MPYYPQPYPKFLEHPDGRTRVVPDRAAHLVLLTRESGWSPADPPVEAREAESGMPAPAAPAPATVAYRPLGHVVRPRSRK